MNRDERAGVRIIIAIFGVILGYFISTDAYNHFIATGVSPNVAIGGSIAIFALVLGAFGLIAVRVNL